MTQLLLSRVRLPSPSAPHFLLRPFSRGSRSRSLSIYASCSHYFSLCVCYQAFLFYAPTIYHLLFALISISHVSISPLYAVLIMLPISSFFYFFYPAKHIHFPPSPSLPLILFYPISQPPAVAEDDKPPYTILCAQAALDKSCSVEGVGVGVGAGWGPQRNGFNQNYLS